MNQIQIARYTAQKKAYEISAFLSTYLIPAIFYPTMHPVVTPGAKPNSFSLTALEACRSLI
jgi:hypothetical protein